MLMIMITSIHKASSGLVQTVYIQTVYNDLILSLWLTTIYEGLEFNSIFIKKEYFYPSRFYSSLNISPTSGQRKRMPCPGQRVGREKGLARCIQIHLEPLTDVQTIASGEVFLLIDCSVAKVFLDNKHCSKVVTDQVVKPQRDLSRLVQKIG